MRVLHRLSFGTHANALLTPAPELAPSVIRSPEQLAALRAVVVAARESYNALASRRPDRVDDDLLVRLGRELTWLDSLRTHLTPVAQPADAAALWEVADVCKQLLPQLRARRAAIEAGDLVAIERWAMRLVTSLGQLESALEGVA